MLSNWWSLISWSTVSGWLQHGHLCCLFTHSVIHFSQYLWPHTVSLALSRMHMHIEHCMKSANADSWKKRNLTLYCPRIHDEHDFKAEEILNQIKVSLCKIMILWMLYSLVYNVLIYLYLLVNTLLPCMQGHLLVPVLYKDILVWHGQGLILQPLDLKAMPPPLKTCWVCDNIILSHSQKIQSI